MLKSHNSVYARVYKGLKRLRPKRRELLKVQAVRSKGLTVRTPGGVGAPPLGCSILKGRPWTLEERCFAHPALGGGKVPTCLRLLMQGPRFLLRELPDMVLPLAGGYREVALPDRPWKQCSASAWASSDLLPAVSL